MSMFESIKTLLNKIMSKKITGLPLATTPLAGGEVFAIVQGGATRQVSVSALSGSGGLTLADTTSNLSVPGDEEKILRGNVSGNIIVNNVLVGVSVEVGSEDGVSGLLTISDSSGNPGRIDNDAHANGTRLSFPLIGPAEVGSTTYIGAIIVKSNIGDPSVSGEAFCINTADNTLKFYADGAWRTITSW